MESTEEQETKNLRDILDIELCQKELNSNSLLSFLKNEVSINESNNDITKVNKNGYIYIYGKSKYGNVNDFNNQKK